MPGDPFGNRSLFDARGSRVVAPAAMPKRLPSVRAKTADGSAHLARVKELPCACCGAAGPSDAHHIRTGQGGAQKAPDFLAVSLCKPCHQGSCGVHGDKSAMRLAKLTELDMLAITIRRLLS